MSTTATFTIGDACIVITHDSEAVAVPVAPKERAVSGTTAKPSRVLPSKKQPKVAKPSGDGPKVQAEIRALVAEGKFGAAALVAEGRGWHDQAQTLRNKADKAPLPKEALAHRVPTPKASKAKSVKVQPKVAAAKVTDKPKTAKPSVPAVIQQKLDLAQDEADRHQSPKVTKGKVVAKSAPKVRRDANASAASKVQSDAAKLQALNAGLGHKIVAAITGGAIACDQLMSELCSGRNAMLRAAKAADDETSARTARSLQATFDKAIGTLRSQMKAHAIGAAPVRATSLV